MLYEVKFVKLVDICCLLDNFSYFIYISKSYKHAVASFCNVLF